MGVIVKSNAPARPLLAVAMGLSLLASGCDDIDTTQLKDKLGLAKVAPAAAPVPEAALLLASHWIPAGTDVAGVSQRDWTVRWWQWANRFPFSAPPYRDPDGSVCADYQEDGPVWFLAGTNGRFDAQRQCTIPANKHLFVPVFNTMSSPGVDGANVPCARLQADAAEVPDNVVSALVLLDGRPVGEIKQMRVASPGCFDPSAGDAGPGRWTAASDGLWLMLSPLPPGKHQLAVAAGWRHKNDEMLQNFRYDLDVQGGTAATSE